MADIRLYNTLTHRLDDFSPLSPPRVTMYNCGPTVYDFAHIGNFRTFLFADVLRRFLELTGYDVQQVMNLTDVGHMTDDQLADGGGEDKMQLAAARLKDAKKQGQAHTATIANPDDPYQVAEFYIQAFLADARMLKLKVADEYPQHMPRATAYVGDMVAMVQTLIKKGHAYKAVDGAVYFAVESFPDYGRLSGNSLDQLRGGAGGRVVLENQAGKRHPADFLLWKPDASHLMKWDPKQWGLDAGEGYPGWHIECSAMARAVLGQPVIDIHTGGEDNIFPHHECEIAQTCGSTGQPEFARYWLHARHLMVEGAKMSKSKGNFFTVRQILDGQFTDRPVDPAVLRYELIKSNYRTQMNFTRRGLEDSAANVRRLRDFAAGLGDEAAQVGADHPILQRFLAALGEDLNMAGALAVVFEMAADPPADSAEALGVLRQMDRVLGVLPASEARPDAAEEKAIQQAAALDEARRSRDFSRADAIRAELQAAGFDVKTTKDGTVVTRRLA